MRKCYTLFLHEGGGRTIGQRPSSGVLVQNRIVQNPRLHYRVRRQCTGQLAAKLPPLQGIACLLLAGLGGETLRPLLGSSGGYTMTLGENRDWTQEFEVWGWRCSDKNAHLKAGKRPLLPAGIGVHNLSEFKRSRCHDERKETWSHLEEIGAVSAVALAHKHRWFGRQHRRRVQAVRGLGRYNAANFGGVLHDAMMRKGGINIRRGRCKRTLNAILLLVA